MGIAIENANAIVKAYADNFDSLCKSLKAQTFKVSQIQGMQYKLSYIFATSQSGYGQEQNGTVEPLDTAVTLRIDLNEFPTYENKQQKSIKFGMTKDKFLQFSRDMKEALALLEAQTSLE